MSVFIFLKRVLVWRCWIVCLPCRRFHVEGHDHCVGIFLPNAVPET